MKRRKIDKGLEKERSSIKKEERSKGEGRTVFRLLSEGIDLGEAKANLKGRIQQQDFTEYILD